MTYQVAIIGTGDPEDSDRYAMAHRHARGYERLEECELIACADIDRENALVFADTFGIDDGNVYESYGTMLTGERLDIVSVCTPPKTHGDIVIDCAESGVVDAIHCEKPMAATWRECRDMVAVAEREGVQLTFNHQRRFAEPYRKAKQSLDDGRIGELRRIEIGGPDLYDYGTHLFDMCGYMTDQTPVDWVLGQVDYRNSDIKYGLPQEAEALARWRYTSGVDGFASTGNEGIVRCHVRLVGTEGTIEIGREDGPPLRYRVDGAGWKQIETGRDGIWRPHAHPLDRIVEYLPVGPDWTFSDPTYVSRGIADLVSALRDDTTPELAAENALQTTETIFACWESARRGGRIELPLDIEDNPLRSMIGPEEPPLSS